MRRALALCALTGCTQIFGLESPTVVVPDDAVSDATADVAADAIDARTSTLTPCGIGGMSVVACFDFEDTVENLAPTNLLVQADTYTFDTGILGRAVRMDASTTFTIAETAVLDLPAVTMEAWVKLDALPAAGFRMGVWDNNGQYGLFVREGGAITCTNGTGLTTPTGQIAAGVWTHIACSTDMDFTTIYRDGVQVSQVAGGTLSGAGTSGTAVGGNSPTGERLVGEMDSVRLYSVARTHAQICAAAGISC